jgi:hypothetical protein
MTKINWSRTQKFRESEEKFEPGTELRNGRIVAPKRPDSLAARAAQAEKDWLDQRAAKAKKQRRRRRKGRQKPSNAEMHRLKQIRSQLGYSE